MKSTRKYLESLIDWIKWTDIVVIVFLAVQCQGEGQKNKGDQASDAGSDARSLALPVNTTLTVTSVDLEASGVDQSRALASLLLYQNQSDGDAASLATYHCPAIVLGEFHVAFALNGCRPRLQVQDAIKIQSASLRATHVAAGTSESAKNKMDRYDVDCKNSCLRIGQTPHPDRDLVVGYAVLKARFVESDIAAIGQVSRENLAKNAQKSDAIHGIIMPNPSLMPTDTTQIKALKLALERVSASSCETRLSDVDEIEGSPVVGIAEGGRSILKGFLHATPYACGEGQEAKRWQVDVGGLPWLKKEVERSDGGQPVPSHDIDRTSPGTSNGLAQESLPVESVDDVSVTPNESYENVAEIQRDEAPIVADKEVMQVQQYSLVDATLLPNPSTQAVVISKVPPVTTKTFTPGMIEITRTSTQTSAVTRVCWGVALTRNQALVLSPCVNEMKTPSTGVAYRARRSDATTMIAIASSNLKFLSDKFAILTLPTNFFSMGFALDTAACPTTWAGNTLSTFGENVVGTKKTIDFKPIPSVVDQSQIMVDSATWGGPFWDTLSLTVDTVDPRQLSLPWVDRTKPQNIRGLTWKWTDDRKNLLAYKVCGSDADLIGKNLN
jgi:hypothetical protein